MFGMKKQKIAIKQLLWPDYTLTQKPLSKN
jgi:hypothetical protein